MSISKSDSRLALSVLLDNHEAIEQLTDIQAGQLVKILFKVLENEPYTVNDPEVKLILEKILSGISFSNKTQCYGKR